MKTALCLIRQNPVYRHDAFVSGMTKLGYQVEVVPFHKRIPSPDDVVLIWNRYGTGDKQAELFEKQGATVIVVENAYVDMHNTKKAFAMALNRHNGAGTWPAPEHSRLELLKADIQPWKESGTHIVVLPQRGVGLPGVAMPKEWPGQITPKLKRISKSALVYVRPHPGVVAESTPLEDDLKKAWCVVTWGSSAATKALILGVPVFYQFDRWIAGPAACHNIEKISLEESPISFMGDREAMLQNLAWAQWTVDEVATGEPMLRLIELNKRQRIPTQ